MLEIISCRPVISRSEENGHISKWVNSMVAQGDINGIVDERLRGKYDGNSVWKAVEVALSCVSVNSGKRPTMNHVVAELKSCLAMELERTPESQGFDSTNSVNMMSIVMDYSESAPMARWKYVEFQRGIAGSYSFYVGFQNLYLLVNLFGVDESQSQSFICCFLIQQPLFILPLKLREA